MSAVLSQPAAAKTDVAARLAFQKQLQAVTNKIHATNNIDEIMLEVSADVCALFNADRLTIYSMGEDKQAIVSKVKTGLNSFKDLKLPIAEHSIAGYVALSKKTINIKDCYDDAELRSLNPNLRFLQEVDKRTGYRTKQQLEAPIAEAASGELIGVIQIINNKAGVPFGSLAEEGVSELSQTLAIAFRQLPKARIVFRVGTQKDFKETVNQFYGAEKVESDFDVTEMFKDEEGEVALDGASADEASAAADNELVKLVNKVIVDAYNQGASDIHIEPYPGKAKTEIRFRKDGSLGPYLEVPAAYRAALAARIKIMCDLDISEKRKPQDGKIKFKKFGPLDIELRVATIPTAGGVEDIVMRILAAGEPIPLEKMGFTPRNLEELQKTVQKPYGLFFVCGPTGSGKTTTLHSVLKFLNTPDTKIWTAEDH